MTETVTPEKTLHQIAEELLASEMSAEREARLEARVAKLREEQAAAEAERAALESRKRLEAEYAALDGKVVKQLAKMQTEVERFREVGLELRRLMDARSNTGVRLGYHAPDYAGAADDIIRHQIRQVIPGADAPYPSERSKMTLLDLA